MDKEMTNENLLNNIGNSTQYSITAHTEKEAYTRVGVCMCVTDSFCCTPETNTALSINYTAVKVKKVPRAMYSIN